MPEYDYLCPDKSCRYEETVRMASMSAGEILKRWPPKCARCGKPMTRRPSRTAVVFKGEGWPGKQSNPARNVEENKTYPAEKSNQEV